MLERYTDTQVANLKVLQGELTKLATAQATFRDQMTSQMTSLREELLAAISGGIRCVPHRVIPAPRATTAPRPPRCA